MGETTTLLDALLEHLLPAPPETLEELTTGWSNRVLRARSPGRVLYLRLPRGAAPLPGIDRRREAAILEAAVAAGLAPPVVHLDPAVGVLVTEGVAAPPLTGERRRTATLVRNLAATLRRIHALPTTTDAHYHPGAWALAVLEAAVDAGAPVPRDALAEARALAEVPLRRDVLCHNDLNPDNLLLGQRIWVLDWEFAAAGDPRTDLVGLAESLGLDREERALLFDAYGLPPLAPRDETALRRAHHLARYAWALAMLARGRVTAEIRGQLERSRLALGYG
jgi:aminoglycoside phosphotransferase (APT) family kinase protein